MNRIGIDIGGTQLRVAAFDDAGTMLFKEVVPNDRAQGPEANLARLAAAIEGWGIDNAGIGIGGPGPADFASGRFLNPPNLPTWENFEIVRFFEDLTGKPAFLNNDANVAGLAEALAGAGRGYDSVFFFTVSTGLGGGFIYQGKIVGGAHSFGAEVFNMIVNEDPYVRGDLNPGSVELQCSGTALGRMASERFGREMGARELFALWHGGDAVATEVVERGSPRWSIRASSCGAARSRCSTPISSTSCMGKPRATCSHPNRSRSRSPSAAMRRGSSARRCSCHRAYPPGLHGNSSGPRAIIDGGRSNDEGTCTCR